jgi:hypothetical protein
MPCPYSTLLGIPGEGVHATRIAGLALFDMVATIIAAALTTYYFQIHFGISLLAWFTLGEILHYIFGVQTAFLSIIGIRAC